MQISADGGGRVEERLERGVVIGGGAWLCVKWPSYAYSNSFRLPGELTAGVRADLDGESGKKFGCEANCTVLWLAERASVNASSSSVSSLHPYESSSSDIIRAFAVLGGGVVLRGGRSMNLRSVLGVIRPLFLG